MKDKLNCGSGKSYLAGYHNIDIRPNCGADEVVNLAEANYPPESFVEIICSDVLIYFDPVTVKMILRNCLRWLKPNGVLTVSQPNLRTLAEILSKRDDQEALEWLYGTAGVGTTNYAENHIRWAYSMNGMATLLEDIGFTILTGIRTCYGLGFKIDAAKRSPLHKIEGHITSQHGEDGVLDTIFTKIGAKHKTCVEIGYDAGAGNNIDLLVDREKWRSLVVDLGLNYPFIPKENMTAFKEEVTAENINELFVRGNMVGEIDLFSLDIDSNEYHVWKALTVADPRVVVVEYNSSFGPEQSITVKYNPHFNRKHPFYHGASLAALTKLADSKGYALVGCDSGGCNAFYVKRELLKNDKLSEIAEISVEAAYLPNVHRKIPWQQQWAQVKDLEYDAV